MRFLGGKFRIANSIAPIILESRPDIVIEPFCGALNVTVAMLKIDKSLRVIASDIHKDLIDMWIAFQDGSFTPPKDCPKELYDVLKTSESSPLRTFVGYGCSFSGKFFGGYARGSDGRNYCDNAYNSLIKIKKYLDRITFVHRSYLDIGITNAVIYCDPPYAGTTKPGDRGEFDHTVFWQWVCSQPNCFVSEYTAPEIITGVWCKTVSTDMHTSNGKDLRVEKLFSTRHSHILELLSLG